MTTLGSEVRIVKLQFSFSNSDVIPASVKRVARETLDEMIERKGPGAGVMVIQPTERCSILEFIEELEASGYELVDAFYKARIDKKDPRIARTYHMVRFVFARNEFAEPSAEFVTKRGVIRADLEKICDDAMWRVRAFLNPFEKNGKEIEGVKALSVNLEARVPFLLPDGKPVVEWQKDEAGQRVGDEPLPIRARFRLQVWDNVVDLSTQGI